MRGIGTPAEALFQVLEVEEHPFRFDVRVVRVGVDETADHELEQGFSEERLAAEGYVEGRDKHQGEEAQNRKGAARVSGGSVERQRCSDERHHDKKHRCGREQTEADEDGDEDPRDDGGSGAACSGDRRRVTRATAGTTAVRATRQRSSGSENAGCTAGRRSLHAATVWRLGSPAEAAPGRACERPGDRSEPIPRQGPARARGLVGKSRSFHLRSLLNWNQQRDLNILAPTFIEAPTGSRIALEYFADDFADGASPVLAVRLQEIFGWMDTPAVNDGRTRVTLHLLSPARRPVQVTQDLRSFWMKTYPEVRKELRARYPRHSWPDDPLTAPPSRGPNRRGT